VALTGMLQFLHEELGLALHAFDQERHDPHR
jgi:hypothetical protein